MLLERVVGCSWNGRSDGPGTGGRITVVHAARADTAATGDVEARIEAQDATSSIQTGISCVDPRGAASRLHLAAAPAVRSITSWIRTDLPNHGCQRYATIASPAEIAKTSGLWVLWHGVVQPAAAPFQVGLSQPNGFREPR